MEEHPLRNRGNENDSEKAAILATVATSSPGKDHPLASDGNSLREELSHLLYRPRPRSEEAIESSLSVIPWKILLFEETTSTANQTKPSQEATSSSSSSSSTTFSSTKEIGEPKSILVLTQQLSPSKDSSFPSVSYLDLRRKQNLSFADDQCAKAKQQLDKGNHIASRAAWSQALQLVPDHLPSLVGYGDFLIQIGKLEPARKVLNEALCIDPTHSLAQMLLSDLSEAHHRNRRHQPYATMNSRRPLLNKKSNLTLTTRESSAYQDALLERQLLASPRDDDSAAAAAASAAAMEDSNANANEGEPSSSSPETDRNRSKRKKHRKHDKDRKKKRSRHKSKRKEKRKHHKRRHSRRKYYSSDDDDDDDDDASENSFSSVDSLSRTSLHSNNSSGSRSSNGSRRASVPSQESSSLAPKKNMDGDETDRNEESVESKRRKRRKRRRDYHVDKRESRTKESSRRRRHHGRQQKRTKNDSSSPARKSHRDEGGKTESSRSAPKTTLPLVS